MKIIHNSHLRTDPIPYLLRSNEPWVRYNTLINLSNRSLDDPEVVESKTELLSHNKIINLIEECKKWPGSPLTRHNDAKHIIHKIALLADFGFKATDPEIDNIVTKILSIQAKEGAFLSSIKIPTRFGGEDKPKLAWMLCDSPTLLYSLLSFDLHDNEQVEAAITHLSSLIEENGWRCVTSVPGFRGPGRKSDHCPYANLIALKALSLVPQLRNSKVCQTGVEAQLKHWENQEGRKIYLFGIGTTFKKLKYPNIWYDILHVVEVLSRFKFVTTDERFVEMLTLINDKQKQNSGFIPESIWREFKDWSFGQKKQPSSWLTYKITMINKRLN